MKEEIFEKPLTPKDFVRKKEKMKTEKPQLYQRVKRLPESRRREKQSKYSELVNAIAGEKKGIYKVVLSAIKQDLTLKSAYPSVEKVLIQIAKRDGVDFSTAIRRQVQTTKGVRIYVSYPEYVRWKEENMTLRIVNNELYIEKKTDRQL